MTIFALINQVHAKGIKLWQENGQLKLKAPKGTLTEDVREQLIAHKQDLIEFLTQVSATNNIPSIVPINRTAFSRLPLSFAQERLWFINQLNPDSAGYNIPAAVIMRGEIDIGQIERAFNLIIARHDNLRTIFPSDEGQAQQRILDKLDFKLDRIDLNHYNERETRYEKAREVCQIEASTPFDLSTGPLLRGKVIKLSSEEHVLLLNMHHIISDGWSTGVLIREFGMIMDALSKGEHPDIPPLPIQYVDYSVWQRKWLEEDGVLERQLAYWQKKLAGVPESLDLVTDYPRPGVQSSAGASHTFTMDARLTRQIKRLAEQQGCTLFMTLLAAFKCLLYRYTGQEDICVGSPIANRQYGETQGLIGMFVNTLALRSQISGEDTFASLLSKVKATCLEAYEHQDTPFEKIVDLVQPQRNMAISPLFQIMVILQNAPLEVPVDARIQPFRFDTGISKFDLTVEFTEIPEGLSGSIEYSTVLFKEQTIERMVEHFIALCRAITAAPTAKIADLDYLGETEKRRLLIEFNQTASDYPREKCIQELFAEQAATHPNKTAVEYENEQLSYQQLYDKSHDLALYLQSLGVKPNNLVGLCMERSLDMIVGMLGILQAGGAYVPLDPEYPDERTTYMLQDSQTDIVLTQEKLKDKLSAIRSKETRLLSLDQQGSEISACADELKGEGVKLIHEVKPHHLAYVLYTSGSTGKPKGVAIEHHSPVALIHWAQGVYSPEELSGVLASTSICFDLSVYEIFLPLSTGGKIILAPNALELAHLSNREAVTLINTVPSAMEELLRSQAIPDSVQTINLAGEPLLPSLVDKIYANSTAQKVYDLYGPSEDTTYSTFVLREQNAPQTIGRPVSNTQIYILDQHKNPQPTGVPGELHIAGEGLARGYLNRPELTEEKFVSNPFNPGTRMYKTGDLARWWDDGNIEYLGRIDTQVKIRGFRIETGEIEARLNQHSEIEDCVVVARGQEANKELIAFYVARDTEGDKLMTLAYEDLRAHLQQTLPDYMLPAAFVSLEAIPLTPNGKVDRRALERMDVTVSSSQVYVAPRNETEKLLVAIWAEILKLDPETIGVYDNFFELGGHSLLATQLMAKLNREFAQLLPLSILFRAPDIASLAQLVLSNKAASFDILVPIQTQGSQPPLFAIPGVGGNVLSLRPLSDALGNTQPFYGLQAVGVDGSTPPLNSVEDTAQANIAALQAIQPTGPYRLIGHSYGGVVAYEMTRLLLEQGEEIEFLILLDSLAPSAWQRQVAPDEHTMLAEIGATLSSLYDLNLDLDIKKLQLISGNERSDYIANLLKGHGLDIGTEQVITFYNVFKANQHCYRSYRPAKISQELNVSLYRASIERSDLPYDYGWNELLFNPIRIYDVTASHFSMLEREHVHEIAKRINLRT